MTTARTLIKRALQKNGVLTKGEAPSGDEASDALQTLNAMLGTWSNDSLLIYARLSESFVLTSGQSAYTIGSGGNFNTARPMQILSAYVRIGNIDYDLDIINGVAYDDITLKSLQSSIPSALYYDGNSPLGTITIYPVPTTGTLYIRSEKQLSSFTTLDTDLDLPPGWDKAIVDNLSIELAPEYGQPVTEAMYMMATNSLGRIKTAVARNKGMDAYPYNGNSNNIYTGWYT